MKASSSMSGFGKSSPTRTTWVARIPASIWWPKRWKVTSGLSNASAMTKKLESTNLLWTAFWQHPASSSSTTSCKRLPLLCVSGFPRPTNGGVRQKMPSGTRNPLFSELVLLILRVLLWIGLCWRKESVVLRQGRAKKRLDRISRLQSQHSMSISRATIVAN